MGFRSTYTIAPGGLVRTVIRFLTQPVVARGRIHAIASMVRNSCVWKASNIVRRQQEVLSVVPEGQYLLPLFDRKCTVVNCEI